jgi:AhpD family alkylhydroperoxidase
LTPNWYQAVIESGTSDTEYVGLIGVLSSILAIDTFRRAVGMPVRALPEPVTGEPTRRRPASAHHRDGAWVPMIPPVDLPSNLATEEERLLARYWGGTRAKPPRALSLVPQEAHAFLRLVEVHYLPIHAMSDFFTQHRAISRAQMELIAARVSVRNECRFCAVTHAKFLQQSGNVNGETYDLTVLKGTPGDGNLAHGELLIAFADASIGHDDGALATVRSEVRAELGDAALVDAAGVVAAFNAIDRVASATGLRADRQAGNQRQNLAYMP